MTLAARADETLLVLTPDPASLTDAYAFLKLMLRRTGTRSPRLLVNMALNATEGPARCRGADVVGQGVPENRAGLSRLDSISTPG